MLQNIFALYVPAIKRRLCAAFERESTRGLGETPVLTRSVPPTASISASYCATLPSRNRRGFPPSSRTEMICQSAYSLLRPPPHARPRAPPSPSTRTDACVLPSMHAQGARRARMRRCRCPGHPLCPSASLCMHMYPRALSGRWHRAVPIDALCASARGRGLCEGMAAGAVARGNRAIVRQQRPAAVHPAHATVLLEAAGAAAAA